MVLWTAEGLRQILGGRWVRPPRAASGGVISVGQEMTSIEIESVTTDSRAAGPRVAFVALKGERLDGHDFVGQALQAGSPIAIVSRDVAVDASASLLRVEDTGAALLAMAHSYRRQLDRTKVIAVAGSNGKTTTVRLIHSMLAAKLRGTASIKSFNNAVGVPLTVLQARRSDDYLICEAGTNAVGELAQLSRVIEPNIGVITSIGREHLEGFGDLRAVLAEEASLFGDLRADGVAVLNADTPGLVEMVRSIAGSALGTLITFGTSSRADVRVLSAINGADGVQFTLNDRSQFFVPIPGIHNACNAAAAIAVARRLGLENELIREALSKAKGPEMRMEQSVHAGVRFVNDAYNANPESAIAAAHAFEDLAIQLKPLRRVVVLGDMLELGGAGPASHEEVARVIASAVKPQVVIVVGPLATSHMAPIFQDSSEVVAVPTLDGEKAGKMAQLIHSGDLVLLKGSRGMRLERLLAAFCEQASLVTEGAPATPKLASP